MISRLLAGTGRVLLAGVVLVAGTAAGMYVLNWFDRPPAPGSSLYEETSRRFYRGLASLDVGLLDDARDEFRRATELVPVEPAAWANLGLVHLRLGEFDAAQPPIERAAALAPQVSEIAFLQGRLETARGRLDEGIAAMRRAMDLDPSSVRARFALAQEIERSGQPDADAEAQKEIEILLEAEPGNLVILLERTRLAAKRADATLLSDSVARLEPRRSAWPPQIADQFDALQRAASAGDSTAAAQATAFLRNVLLPTPAFQEGRLRVSSSAELFAEPFSRFLALTPASATPSPADTALTFTRQPIGADQPAPVAVIATPLNGTDRPAVFAAAGSEVRRLDGPVVLLPAAAAGVAEVTPVSAQGLLAIDWNHDFRTDLVIAGRGGVRLLTQAADQTFADVTRAAGATISTNAFGAWAADLEMDGDLDAIVGVDGGAPVALRNNGDGTWRPLQPFEGVSSLRAFAWGDLDRDGDPDAGLLDGQRRLHVFANRQAGVFTRIEPAISVDGIVALALGDANADGALDLVVLDTDGAIRRLSSSRVGWDDQRLATWADGAGAVEPGSYRLALADLDNNGALDLVVSGSGRARVWIAGEGGQLTPLGDSIDVDVSSAADLDDDGQIDLLGVAGGQPVRLAGKTTKGYHWQIIRPRAQQAAGDQRINSFGIGGDIEVRSGVLAQKQVIAGPVVQFGLGTRTSIDVARIAWPNGVVQAEFDREADQVIVADQRLKGSCPWVFTYDGRGMRFVTDFLWRSPLGLRINAQDTAAANQTEDWVKIRGDELVAKDNAYDVRITAELWETHFFDHVSLMAVDHPADVEVFVDERFSSEAPSLDVHPVKHVRSVAGAWDDTGREVTDLVGRHDGRHLATFERAAYQGLAADHYVEIDVGEPLARDRRQWLLARGWVYPTDSSINVAIGQGGHDRPRGLSLEALGADRRWTIVAPDLGFPAGKNKTVMVDLSQAARVPGVTRLRLRTNLEVYWDWLALADAADDAPLATSRLGPARATLRYRGFSRTDYGRRDEPETPRYHELTGVGQRWRDLVGYYTRFGEVRELLEQVDDRYVIMNAGDELVLSFTALPEPAAGWRRDFVLIGDGWEKDGDFNTSFSQTVQPLPSHDRPDYGRGVSSVDLHDDPVFRTHAGDWQTYHTRFVTPRAFLDGLRRP
jgi:Tfp pilus assembly protein PilF